jgi:hypothetical protein
MVSHIPFKTPKPIINICPMHVTMELVTFSKSTGAEHLNINLVDGHSKEPREIITMVASGQSTMMGSTKAVGPRWLFICLISIELIHTPL